MTVLEAIIAVLREAAQPLKVKDITSRAIACGLWHTAGKTPDATIAACLYANIKRHKDQSLFVQTAPQTFALRDATQPLQNMADSPLDEAGSSQSEARSAHAVVRKPATVATKAKSLATKTCSFTDATERVLETFGDKKPMHYRQITEKALENSWIVT